VKGVFDLAGVQGNLAGQMVGGQSFKKANWLLIYFCTLHF
jgi:hypothetical protein